MKRTSLLITALLFLGLTSITAQSETVYFTLKPTLSPNAEYIVFSFEGDLWRTGINGGMTTRLTAMDGTETDPSISPDGKWLAFASNQYGNSDIYIMPTEGGEIKQLTFHEATDSAPSWGWDSKTLYFASNRFNGISTYTVSHKGGTPERLFGHYFNTIHNAVEHPDTGEIFFNETWESSRFAHRKRYKGAYNPNIKSYNPKTGEYKEYTTYEGKDFGVTFDRNGALYFKSDEANDEYNLYTLDGGQKKQLTDFPTAIMWPKVSADGSKVVFRRDYRIHVYDVASGRTTTPDIDILRVNTLEKKQGFKTDGKITAFDVSPDDKKMAFVSRGRLFIGDVKGKFIKELPTAKPEAVQAVKWLKDNKHIIFTQTVDGYYNWFTINAEDGSGLKQLTDTPSNNRKLTFNSDMSQAVYLRGRNEVCLMDMETLKSRVLLTDELWAMYASIPYFSPDDQYIVYNAKIGFENEIIAYHIANGQRINLTNTKVSESQPYWSPDGKYLYFSSDRVQPSYPYGTRNAKVYRMALDKFETPYKMDEVQKLFEKKEKDEKEDNKEDKKPVVRINTADLMERLELISPFFGQQENAVVIQKDKKTHVLYVSNHSEGKAQLWMTTLEPFENNKTERMSDKTIRNYELVQRGKSIYLLTGGNVHTVDLSGKKLKQVKFAHSFEKSLSDEFAQMFDEAWAGFGENFYNETFHGEDWEALKAHYEQFLPHITSRAQLRLIFNEMLGELNTSHFGFYSNGAEERIYHGSQTAATGILFNNKRPYEVDRIVKQGPADVTGKNIRKGDVLKAVNGVRVDTKENREFYFSGTSRKETVLTFDRNGSSFDVSIHPVSFRQVSGLLYDEWQDANQAYVDKNTGNKIAYVHMKNMGTGELNKFYHDLVSAEAYKDGLILDLRYNTGGNVHDPVLRFLSQRTYLNWKYREGELTGQSNFGYGDKPIILLINEQSLSDAEMTAAGFKALGLGTIVGTETYRWIIFTSRKSLVDGSSYRLPSWGCYTLDGRNLELEGVAPDVFVGKNFKDRLDGNHPQLDKAIELILSQVNK
jgi:tricorn protease